MNKCTEQAETLQGTSTLLPSPLQKLMGTCPPPHRGSTPLINDDDERRLTILFIASFDELLTIILAVCCI